MTVPERALRALRRSIAVLETAGARAVREPETAPFAGLDHAGLDHALGGGIARGAVHEVFAATAPDGAAARGFAALLALRAASPGRPLLWLSEDALLREIGEPNAEGLADLGLAPDVALLVRARDGLASLRGAVEAARCAGLGAVLVESWGAAKGSTLTASRRLALAAKESGVTIVLARTGAALRSQRRRDALACRRRPIAGFCRPCARARDLRPHPLASPPRRPRRPVAHRVEP